MTKQEPERDTAMQLGNERSARTLPRHRKLCEGVPSRDDQHLFEMLVLEGAQAGLSWSTILNKRSGYRRAFADFEIDKVARFTPKHVDALVLDESIVRHRGKIEAAITNARAVQQIQAEHGSLANFIWSFVDQTPIQNDWASYQHAPASTEISDALSKGLKRYGWQVRRHHHLLRVHAGRGAWSNDHQTDCDCRARLRGARQKGAGNKKVGLEGGSRRET